MTVAANSDPGWRQQFRDADSLSPDASAVEKRRRGHAFEKILAGMFEEAGLRPRLRYRPAGEEIDGSIWFEGRTILVEAKWTQDPHPASSLYQFRGKVDGKLSGTLGLFISMAGFSTDAVDALVAGKELNLILADGDDMRLLVEGGMGVRDALELKLRAAGDAGTPFVPLGGEAAISQHGGATNIVAVEGRFDARAIEALRSAHGASKDLIIVPAGGPTNIGPLLDALLGVASGPVSLTVVIDGDGLSAKLHDRISDEVDALVEVYPNLLETQLLTLSPNLDTALGLVSPDEGWQARDRIRRWPEARLREALSNVDLGQLNAANSDLPALLRAIGVDEPG